MDPLLKISAILVSAAMATAGLAAGADDIVKLDDNLAEIAGYRFGDSAGTLDEIEQLVRKTINDIAEVVPIHVHFNYQDGRRRILVEVVGPKPVSPDNAAVVQARLVEELGSDTEINLWYRNEFIVSRDGYSTYEELTAPLLMQKRKQLHEIFRSDQGVWADDDKDASSSKINTAVSMTGN